MLHISDALLREIINEMKRQVDFKSNKNNFLDNMLNKKIKWDKKTKEYFAFLHKENLIHNEHYKINNYDKEFIELAATLPLVQSDKYSLSLYKYQKDQVLALADASPTFNYLQGKNLGIMQEDLVVPCISYDNKPFCIMPIKEIMHVQQYAKPRGRVLIIGVGTGCATYYLDKNKDISELDVFEPNFHIRKIFVSGVYSQLSNKTKIIEDIKKPWEYDKIFVCDDFLEEKLVNELFQGLHNNKKVKFSNAKTLKNNLKLEIFRQLVIFVGDTSVRSKDSEIGKNIYDYFEDNDVTLHTFSDFICFIDDNFEDLIKKNQG